MDAIDGRLRIRSAHIREETGYVSLDGLVTRLSDELRIGSALVCGQIDALDVVGKSPHICTVRGRAMGRQPPALKIAGSSGRRRVLICFIFWSRLYSPSGVT